MVKRIIAGVIPGVILCASMGIFSQTVVEQNDFSTSLGHWTFYKWDNNAAYVASIQNGWARVNAGPNSADFWTTINACALYYKPDKNLTDWTFETCFRQDNWDVSHHRSNRSVGLTTDLTVAPGAYAILEWSGFDEAGNSACYAQPRIGLEKKTGDNMYFSPCSTAFAFTGSKCYVKITKEPANKYTFYCSLDSATWKKVDISTIANFQYILLADSYANGNYTEYDYVKLTTTSSAVSATTAARAAMVPAITLRANGNVTVATGASVQVSLYDLKGACRYSARLSGPGSHTLHTGIVANGNYIVRMSTNAGTSSAMIMQGR